MKSRLGVMLLACVLVSTQATLAVENLLFNPGFLDVDLNGDVGDGWDQFGFTGFNAFFGVGNPHASLFGDDALNDGGVYQLGRLGSGGTTYQFDLMDTRIEANWDARLRFGLEFYGADDTTKLGEVLEVIDTATRLSLPNVDGGGAANGAVFSMQGTAVPGTVFVRPLVTFDMVNPDYFAGLTEQANSFVFNSFLSEAPGVGDEFLKNSGFEDLAGDGNVGDYWRSYGAAGFNDFFGGNGHASLFSDMPGNFGGIYQSSQLGTEGKSYEFSLTDVRIEENVMADFRFGLEYYGDDDFTKLGESIVALDTSTTGDGLSFTMNGTAAPGTKYVRPVVLFDNVTSTAAGQENVFIFEATLTEIMSASSPDFDNNGIVDGDDVDALVMEIVQMTNAPLFDLTGDGLVDGSDLTEWLAAAGAINLPSGNSYLVGDADLDGSVDVTDFNFWNANKFTSTGKWTLGDFNADGVTDVGDFNDWNSSKFQSADGAAAAVPEPGCIGSMLFCSAVLLYRRRGVGDAVTRQARRATP